MEKKKTNKIVIVFLVLIIGIVALFFLKGETVSGVVVKADDHGIMLDADRGGRFVENPTTNQCLVEINAKNSRIDFTEYQVGQRVVIKYDGTVLESSPPQIFAKKITADK